MKKIVLILFICVLLSSCTNNGEIIKTFGEKNFYVQNTAEFVHNDDDLVSFNENPSTCFSAEIYDSKGKILKSGEQIVYNGKDIELKILLKNYLNKDEKLICLILVDGLLATIKSGESSGLDLKIDLPANEEKELNLVLDLSEVTAAKSSKFSVVFISDLSIYEFKSMSPSMPIKNYTSVIDYILINESKLQNTSSLVSKKYQTVKLSEIDKSYTVEEYKNVYGNSLNKLIYRQDRSRGFFQKLFQFQSFDELDKKYYFDASGKPGEYVTLLFVNNELYPAFNGKYHLQYTIKEDQVLTTVADLPMTKEYSELAVFTVSLPLGFDESNVVYDSPKVHIMVTELQLDDKIIIKKSYYQVHDNNDDGTNHFEPTVFNDYDGGYIDIKYDYSLDYFSDEEQKLMILVNGVPQYFSANGNEEALEYNCVMSSKEENVIDIRFKPQFTSETKIINVHLFSIFEPSKPYYYESMPKFMSTAERYPSSYNVVSVNPEVNEYIQNSVYEEIPKTTGVKRPENFERGIYVYKNGKSFYIVESDNYIKVNKEEDLLLNYEINKLEEGEYVIFALLNNEIIDLKDDKKFIYYTLDSGNELSDNKIIEFKIDKSKIKDLNTLIFFTTKVTEMSTDHVEINSTNAFVNRFTIEKNAVHTYKSTEKVLMKTTGEQPGLYIDFENNDSRQIYSMFLGSKITVFYELSDTTGYITNNNYAINNDKFFDYDVRKGNCLINAYAENGAIFIEKYMIDSENVGSYN